MLHETTLTSASGSILKSLSGVKATVHSFDVRFPTFTRMVAFCARTPVTSGHLMPMSVGFHSMMLVKSWSAFFTNGTTSVPPLNFFNVAVTVPVLPRAVPTIPATPPGRAIPK